MQIETATGAIEVSDAIFGCKYNEALVHQALNYVVDRAHTGSKAQKKRSMVAGGGRKPWRQKGTGNARAGSNSSPLWRGGGRAFAATPVRRKLKLNKKMYRHALRSLVAEVNRRGGLQVVETLELEQPKTRLLAARLKELALQSVLIVTDGDDPNLWLAANNIPAVGVITADELDPFNLLRFEKVLMTRAALEKLQERLA